ncbi:uncharacterized protein LOC117282089 [Cryptotermes secundus]|uniref:uncharacterized protein LOC117282089 n=1 Tax=Cryptotermes secundus TaxID=105785 RepID=UPI001454D970|nr:uncharacterized protein LOC117282089 [Cryptotermes secundus]
MKISHIQVSNPVTLPPTPLWPATVLRAIFPTTLICSEFSWLQHCLPPAWTASAYSAGALKTTIFKAQHNVQVKRKEKEKRQNRHMTIAEIAEKSGETQDDDKTTIPSAIARQNV